MSNSRTAYRRWAFLALAVVAPAADGQTPGAEPLRLNGLSLAGARASMTESWGALRVDLTNTGPDGRQARVVVFFPERPDVHYTRDAFVPGRSAVTTWVTVGPAPVQSGSIHRDVEIVLYDRTGGGERVVPPAGPEKVRSAPFLYRPREPTTTVLMPESASDSDDPQLIARAVRDAAGLSEAVGMVHDRFLPPFPEAFDGVDVLVLAGNRLAADPAGRLAVRRWVEQGGTLWVLLDRVDPDLVAALLGDAFDVQVIDRVGLTAVRLHRAADDLATAEAREHDRPVELVRVIPGLTDTAIHSANGWPASFVRPVGRGRVFVTTLGARGWYRPRTAREPRARFDHFPNQPVPLNPLTQLAARLHPKGDPPAVPTDALRDELMQQVGYTVVGRPVAAGVFGGLVLAVVGLGLGLRRSRRPELVGWLAPAAAAAAAVVFVGLGEWSRRGVPATVGMAAVVDAVPGTGDASASGVFAIYRPAAGFAPLGTANGAVLEFDDAGLEGRARQRVVTDLDAWHWEGLDLPAGVRTGTFRATLGDARLGAVARFGSDGIAGRLTTGPFRGPADGLLLTAARDTLPVRFDDGDAFSAGGADALPPGQYLSAAVLTDRQQRRQAVYRQLLGETLPRHWEGRTLLLTWAEPGELPFRAGDGDRVVGTALLAVPVEFEHPPAGTSVTVPAGFVPYVRIVRGRPWTPALDGYGNIEMELRFQLPPSVVPLTVERARFTARVRMPGRTFTVSGHGDAGLVPVYEADGPLDPIRIDVADPQLLRTDPEGGLRLTVRISQSGKPPPGPPAKDPPPEPKGPPAGKGGKGPPTGKGPAAGAGKGPDSPESPWKIEALGLEVVGRTAAR